MIIVAPPITDMIAAERIAKIAIELFVSRSSGRSNSPTNDPAL